MSDLRLALRNFLKNPGFTTIAIVTLALGIGLNTSMFSLMNMLILRPISYPDREHLVRIYRTTPQSQNERFNTPDYLDLRREAAEFLDLAAFRDWAFTLSQPGRPATNLNSLRVSGNFFSVLGLQPKLGRFFTAEDDQPGNHVIILSHETWLAQFGGDPGVVNRDVQIDGEATTIVGVMPPEFSSVFLWGPGDAFRPLAVSQDEKVNRIDASLGLISRLPAAMSLAQANARLGTVLERLAEIRQVEKREEGIRAVSLQESTQSAEIHLLSWLLVGLAGFVLLIVCSNLANLQLARAVARAREFAIRAALGASRFHLLRPLLIESVLLALAGGLCGLLVALWANDWLLARFAADFPVTFDLSIDWRVMVFAILVSLGTGLIFGLMPAWLASRVPVNATLKTGARGSTGDRSQNRFRRVLIVLQFAVALVLLVCAGFFIRGLEWVLKFDPRWQPTPIAQGVINLSPVRYPTPERSYEFYTRLQERLRTLPGVEDVAIAWTLPFFQFMQTRNYVVEGRDLPPAGREPLVAINAATPGFVNTLQIRLVSGRNIAESDTLSAPRVALINQSMADALFPNESPLGRRIGSADPDNRNWMEIVGVFADLGLAANPTMQTTSFQALLPLAQDCWNYATVAVRSSNPAALLQPLRRTIEALDPNIAVTFLNTGDGMVAMGAARFMKMTTTLLAAFGALGLFLAALGLYGVIAGLVTQRTPEIGVRLALGAQFRDVVWLVLGSGLRLTLYGTLVGIAGSLAAGQLFATLMKGSGGIDVMTIVWATVILVLVATLASYLPARRATKVDPLTALRAD